MTLQKVSACRTYCLSLIPWHAHDAFAASCHRNTVLMKWRCLAFCKGRDDLPTACCGLWLQAAVSLGPQLRRGHQVLQECAALGEGQHPDPARPCTSAGLLRPSASTTSVAMPSLPCTDMPSAVLLCLHPCPTPACGIMNDLLHPSLCLCARVVGTGCGVCQVGFTTARKDCN